MEKEEKKRRGLMSLSKAEISDFVRRNLLLIAEILLCIVLYIGNRYGYQRDQVLAEQLRRELVDMEYGPEHDKRCVGQEQAVIY